MPRYSKEFKSRMVQRLMGPSALSANALAEEVGISHSALSAWLREARTLAGMTRSSETPPETTTEATAPSAVPTTTPVERREPRSAQDQLRILALASSLEGDALGAMLRREGVHAAELEAWRETVLDSLRGRPPAPATSTADRKRIQHLERELARKEKALVEAAALLMLQKKVRAYLGDEDEHTDARSER
jgi:transposase-like protein